MPNQVSSELIRRLQLVQKLDQQRPANDPFKLPLQLRLDVEFDPTELGLTDLVTVPAEGARADASTARRRAFEQLERQLRGGYAPSPPWTRRRSTSPAAAACSRPTAGLRAKSFSSTTPAPSPWRAWP